MDLPWCEPYKIKMVENIYSTTAEERTQWIEKAHYNIFNLKSNQVFIDLLTDSGTGAMSDAQWAELMRADESYAGSRSFDFLQHTIEELTGYPYVLPTHQGRAAENILFSTLIKEGDIIPGNAHFDTTKGHIEFRKAHAVDCTIDEAYDTEVEHPFKGNLDLRKLEKVLQTNPKDKIPFILITVTNNTAGGQPVSMQNIREVAELTNKYGIPVWFDGARYAENAYFIKTREVGQMHKSIREIVKEMFSYGVGMTMSAKKDGLANMGGFIATCQQDTYKKASNFTIIYEGYITYGGMSGRDMAALAQGLHESAEFAYLESRVTQVEYLGKLLKSYGIPIQNPVGGHAVFVDALKFYPNIPREQFPAQTLVIDLYKHAGVRCVEIGAILADRDPVTRENRYPKTEFVRLAIPRRTYTQHHMEYVAVALKNLFDHRDEKRTGYAIHYEPEILRHFTVELAPVGG